MMKTCRAALVAAFMSIGAFAGVTASAADTSEGFETTFDTPVLSGWRVSQYDFHSEIFSTDWRSWQTRVGDGLSLKLSTHASCPNSYAGAAVRRENPTGYGRYEVRLQAADGDGVITGFFVYTGKYYGTRHDEIDIEILGRDTTKMNIAWFVDGKLTDHRIDLGFDAADGMHDYAFEWHEDRIDWYVDGRHVFRATREDGPLPAVPGLVFANVWAADPSLADWAGEIEHDVYTHAHIERMSFTPFPDPDATLRYSALVADGPAMSRLAN